MEGQIKISFYLCIWSFNILCFLFNYWCINLDWCLNFGLKWKNLEFYGWTIEYYFLLSTEFWGEQDYWVWFTNKVMSVSSHTISSWYSLQDEMFQKFNFDTEWAVRLISKITNDEDLPIEGDAIVKQVIIYLLLKLLCLISKYLV